MSTPSEVGSEARRLVAAGLSVIPIRADGTKAPDGSVLPAHPEDPTKRVWKPFQARFPTDEELRTWFGNGCRRGLGLVGGVISGNLEHLDFDSAELFGPYGELVEEKAPGLLARLVQIKTPRPGWRLTYRCEEPVEGNQPLARRQVGVLANGKPEIKATIETRGEGGYAVIPGSPPEVHETRRPYVLIAGDLAAPPVITAAERQILLNAARALTEYIEPEQHVRKPRPAAAGPREDGLLPGDDFNDRGDVVALLKQHGWAQIGNSERWRRPGKDKGWSATLGHVAPNLLCVFSTSAAPLEGGDRGRGYDPFSVYTHLEHDGDFSAAAKALYAQGYGERVKPSRAPDYRDDDAPPDREAPNERVPDRACEGEHKGYYRNSAPVEITDPRSVDMLAANVDSDEKEDNLTRRLAEAILQEDCFAQDVGGKLYWFTAGIYRAGGEKRIQERVKGLTIEWEEKWTSYRANEVTRYIAVDCPALWERPPTDRVSLLNGILVITGRELLKHDAQFLSTVQLPVRYDPDATCPANEKFVKDVFPDDAQEVAWELFADELTPDHADDDRAVLLQGGGSNGKSVFLEALMRFVGGENVSNVSLQKLAENRFASARLLGKMANVCPDLPSTHLTDSSTFKMITSGDPIDAEYKGRDGFTFRPFARLLFSCNPLPRSADATEAFFRRWLVIPFTRKFEGDGETNRAQLVASLTTPQELSGVLNKALAVHGEVRRRKFTESQTMRAAWLEMRATTDPLAVWLDRHTVERFTNHFGGEAFIAKGELHRRYSRSCESSHRPPMTATAFSLALKKLRPSLQETRKVVNSLRQEVWFGIDWQPEADGEHDMGQSLAGESEFGRPVFQ